MVWREKMRKLNNTQVEYLMSVVERLAERRVWGFGSRDNDPLLLVLRAHSSQSLQTVSSLSFQSDHFLPHLITPEPKSPAGRKCPTGTDLRKRGLRTQGQIPGEGQTRAARTVCMKSRWQW